MLNNLNPSERAGIVGVVNPDAHAAGTYTTGWIDMRNYFALMGLVLVGALVATATVDAAFEQATDASGTGAKAVTGSAIAQLTQAGTDDNKQVAINLQQADLDRNNNFRFVRLSVTLGTAGGDMAALVVALDPRFGAASANDAATVDEVVG